VSYRSGFVAAWGSQDPRSSLLGQRLHCFPLRPSAQGTQHPHTQRSLQRLTSARTLLARVLLSNAVPDAEYRALTQWASTAAAAPGTVCSAAAARMGHPVAAKPDASRMRANQWRVCTTMAAESGAVGASSPGAMRHRVGCSPPWAHVCRLVNPGCDRPTTTKTTQGQG
jgi:hypothetical protein